MDRIAIGALGLLLASATLAQAGALDRTGQPVIVLFEDGNYAELSYAFTFPSVSGTFTDPGTGAAFGSGNVGEDFSQGALAFKYDLTDRISVAAIVEQPFGADVDYSEADPFYPIVGSEATFDSVSVTVLGRYEFGNGLSAHGGARVLTIDADLFVQSGGVYTYDADFESDQDVGYVVGAAYERPEIGLLVSLTYSSETSFSNETSFVSDFGGAVSAGEGLSTDFTMPQSVNLDFRTGIAANTLLFGSIRWADWSETEINVPEYIFNPVVDYESDVYTYTLGLGRRFTPSFAASAGVIFESGEEDLLSNLSPTDGQLGLLLGATYTIRNVELSAGLRYAALGEGTTETIGAEFEGNDALSLGLRVGYRF